LTSYRYEGSGGPGFPDGIKYLLIWNGIVFLLQQILRENFPLGLFGLVPNAVWHGYVWQLATYMFLHGGFFHILFNMFVLWMFGSEIERLWGTRRFVSYYFFTGIGAALVNVAVTPHGHIPTIGASGAVYGILLAYAVLFPERRVLLYFLIPIPVRVFVIGLAAIALFSSLTQQGSQISHITHLGGFVFGWLYMRGFGPSDFWRRLTRRRRRGGMRVIDFTRDRYDR